ncbi:unnamed protein product [marine sediment metagenome]|uniref:Uncharacterized protein n=1 Tax=marine sediment metagenome TaxID=412755 RepID=X1RKQ0_9ZZZZ
MNQCNHLSDTQPAKFVLRRTGNGEYFPLTGNHCRKCGEEFWSDGIWWLMQGIPPNVIFEPEPDGDEIIIDAGLGKIRAVRKSDVFKG